MWVSVIWLYHNSAFRLSLGISGVPIPRIGQIRRDLYGVLSWPRLHPKVYRERIEDKKTDRQGLQNNDRPVPYMTLTTCEVPFTSTGDRLIALLHIHKAYL